MQPVLNNKTYNFLKWLCLIALPALAGFYLTVSALLGLPYGTQVAGVLAALATLLGVLIGLSTAQYNGSDAKYDGVLEINKNDPSVLHALDLDQTEPRDLARKNDLVLKVKRLDIPIPPPEDV